MHRVAQIAMVVVLALTIFLLLWFKRPQSTERAESREVPSPLAVLGATGRVEGRGETIALGASADGVVERVFVVDGQQVSKGALLAKIGCADISAEIEQAKAEAESARQARIRLLRGHRDEERQAAAQEADGARAVLTQAQEHFQRFDALYQKGEISRDAFEQAKRDQDVAQADYKKAVDEQNLTDAQPLPEEVSRADAEVAAAERTVSVAVDKLDKCNVRAPISGTILKVMTKAGESYSTLLPHPLFTLADESVRRVRAEVDERDIGKVKLGQASIITVEGFPGRRFHGEVIEISPAMKPKAVLSDDPSQKVDRDVLDVIIQLKPSGQDLPLGLRVTAQMTNETEPLPSSSSPPSSKIPQDSEIPASRAVQSSMRQVPAKSDGIVLQVAAMTYRQNADALSAMLQTKSFPAFVLEPNGDHFYRVDIGPYQDPAQARAIKDELRNQGFASVIERPFAAFPR